MPTRPGLKSVIEDEGLGEVVTDWIFKDKLSMKEISNRLRNEYNVELSEPSICNFKKFVIKSVPDFLAQNKEYRDKLANKFLNTVELLMFALEEIKTKIENSKEGDWKKHSTYVALLLSECHMLLKRAGEIKPSQFIEKQEINMIEINNSIQIEIVRLIDEKKIDFNTCAPEIQELYRKNKHEIPA